MPKDSQKRHKLIIVGSGAAGFTAALYAARANLSPLVIAGSKYGGQLMLTTDVENYPGFPQGIQGPELMDLFKNQAEHFGAKCIFEDVTRVDFKRKPFEIVAGKIEYLADCVIIATGADAQWLGVPGEEKLIGRGVSSCAPCDAPFFKNKVTIVVGGGDSAMEEALFLTKFAKSVTVVHRRDTLKASKIMQERAFKNPKIKFIWNTVVSEIVGNEKVEKVKLKNLSSGKEEARLVDAVFVAIGHKPNTEFLKGQIELDEKGYVKISNCTKTSVEGVFVAGDVHDHRYRQVVTAAGFGCMAAMDAEKYLEEQEG